MRSRAVAKKVCVVRMRSRGGAITTNNNNNNNHATKSRHGAILIFRGVVVGVAKANEDGNGVRIGWMKASKFPWYAALFSGSALRCGIMDMASVFGTEGRGFEPPEAAARTRVTLMYSKPDPQIGVRTDLRDGPKRRT